jgi:DNA-binding MarR family transcriptional regulator
MSTGHDLALALRSAYLTFHRLADATLARFGVTADQFVLLAALADGDALTQQELTCRVGSDASTVRAMLLLLEERGLVARRPHPSDGRARRVALTPRGRGGLRRMRQGSEALRDQLLAAVGPDRAVLLDVLGRITRAMATPDMRKPGATRPGRSAAAKSVPSRSNELHRRKGACK